MICSSTRRIELVPVCALVRRKGLSTPPIGSGQGKKGWGKMDSYNMTPEDFVTAPGTAALILNAEAVNREHWDERPVVYMSKQLRGGYVIVYVDENEIDKIVLDVENYTSNVFPLVLGLLGYAELEAAGITQVQHQPFLDLRGNGVLLGFVDTGIDYTQTTFRYEDGTTKICALWDQTTKGNPPPDYLFGSEYTREDIDKALRAEDPYTVVPQKDTVGHGTFLASVAGGREDAQHVGAAPDADIIMVKLREARPFDRARYLIPSWQKNAYSSDALMLGIQYILDVSQRLKKPVAICISLGTNLGSHDGFNPLENYLTKVSGVQGTAVCAAAGNEGHAGHHTQGVIAATGETQNIELRVSAQHEDLYMTLWNYASDRISVSVRSPTGEVVARVPARSGTSSRNRLILERAVVIVEYVFPVESSASQLTRVKILSATPGIWTVTVYGDYILDGNFHAWLPITGFVDPNTKFLSPTPNTTIVTPATALGLVTCGGYNSAANSLYDNTSWGPSRLPIILPDLVAPCVNVGGLYPTGHGAMTGTSVAAAITAGASALMLQWGVVEKNDAVLDSYRIRADLIAGCARDEGIVYPNSQWGYGKLNLLGTFRTLRPY